MLLTADQREGTLSPSLYWAQDKVLGPEHTAVRWRTPPEVVWLVHAGQARVATDATEIVVRPGQWLCARACMRTQRFAPGTRLWSVGFSSGGDGGGWSVAPDLLLLAGGVPLERLTRQLLAAMQAGAGPEHSEERFSSNLRFSPTDWLRTQAVFHAWLACVIEQAQRQGAVVRTVDGSDPRWAQAMATLRRQSWSEESDPIALARSVGVSRRRLEQLFRERSGTTIAEARTRCRIAAAKVLLARPGTSVKAVAAELGYPDPSGFVTWYRRHAGVTPSRWRHGGDA